MAKRIVFFIVLLFMILCACAACASAPDSEAIAGLIEIDYPVGKDLILDQAYEVGIHNHSDQCILFPVDYNIKLFMKNGNKDTELKNIVNYNGENRKLSPEGTYFADNVIYFMPDLELKDYSAGTGFYATIQGYLCNDKDTIINKTFEFSVK